ncbi:MAG: hypothetical protein NZM40_03625 [Sphingomonadaceae bacterium]|nr:hypothetical protein [Thermaurantiacus sp.]MCS6986513.1 hypothetical protein [Sphingomonadaceae bacterium]MDW8414226.1 hypothetical protein [Thermaurantiacus sp.]
MLAFQRLALENLLRHARVLTALRARRLVAGVMDLAGRALGRRSRPQRL